MFRSAIERQVSIIGEAVTKLSKTIRDANPQVPWSRVAGTRHRLGHEYDRVDRDVLWRIASVHVPALLEQVRTLYSTRPAVRHC
jgi:uncharacterized protein with HEPN domain